MNEPTHERDTRFYDEATTLLAVLADTDNWHLKEVELLATRSLFDVVQNSWKEVAWRLDQMTLCKREGPGYMLIQQRRTEIEQLLPTQQYVVCWCEGTQSYVLALKAAMSKERAE